MCSHIMATMISSHVDEGRDNMSAEEVCNIYYTRKAITEQFLE